MNSYPSSPLEPHLFSDSSSASPYSSSSSSASSHPLSDHAPSPFSSPFQPSFDTPLPQPPNAQTSSSWNGTSWPTHPYYNEHYMQQQPQQQHHQQHQQQRQPYYPSAVPYTATLVQSSYFSAPHQPTPPVAYNHSQPNAYATNQSDLIPHAVPALIIPTTNDPHHPTTAHYPEPIPATPTTPPPPPLKFGDVFKGASGDMAWRHSQPVRSLNHAQMRVWQQFESGDTIRSISDQMGLKPNVVLNYIIYALESYSPSPSHPVFIHWPRFSIPPELMERVAAAMTRVGGALGRMDVVVNGLAGGRALDEDVRIAMIRWKMERAVGAAFKPYDMYRVLSAGEAAQRLARQRKEDAGEEAEGTGEGEDEMKEGRKAMAEEKESSSVTANGADTVMQVDPTETKQPPPSSTQSLKPHTDKDRSAEATAAFTGTADPPYPPPLTASEMLFQLSLGGGTSQRCLVSRFRRDWSEIEAVLSKLIAEQLAWKRGLLYCPS